MSHIQMVTNLHTNRNILNHEGVAYDKSVFEWLSLCSPLNLEVVPLALIDHADLPATAGSIQRYYYADTRFPLVLFKQDHNRYFLIDGRHRLYRLLGVGEQTCIAFILKPPDLK